MDDKFQDITPATGGYIKNVRLDPNDPLHVGFAFADGCVFVTTNLDSEHPRFATITVEKLSPAILEKLSDIFAKAFKTFGNGLG